MMKGSGTLVAPAAVLILALLTGGWFLQEGVERENNVYVQTRLFQEIVDHISDRYVDPVAREQLYEYAIDGLFQRLGDPNTSLLDVEEYESFRIQTEGDYGGVGLEITERDDWVTVVTPLPGTPGSRAGIRAGDRIYEVEGEAARGWSVQRAVQVLRGQPGTDVDVRIQRPGVDEPISFTLTREEIQLRSVPFVRMMDDGVGYVPLNLFSETSSREIREAVESLREEGLRGLVLDLRGNPGGVLDQGVEVANLFLPRGADIVETRGQERNQTGSIRASADEEYPDLPVVVLVDGGSASASEIVAGALQDHDRALVLGASTFGKGSVQTLFRLTGGNVLKLTTARWYTPAGRSIHQVDEDPEERMEQVRERGIISLTGQLVPDPDTVDRPRVESFGGRPLYGGGGITPDLIVMPDTLSADETRAVRRLFQAGGVFSTAVFDFAVAYLQERPDLSADFELDREDLEAFRQRLAEAGVDLSDEELRAAERFIAFQLETAIATQEWGQEGEFQRRVPRDPQLLRAIELLRQADSPQALFALAGTPVQEDSEAPGSGRENDVQEEAPAEQSRR